MKFSVASALTILGLCAQAKADDGATIEIVGNQFFYANNGSQFYIKGIAYQQNPGESGNDSFIDPLTDKSACERDLPYLLELSTNVLRVYAVNASANHDDCMNLFKDAGIYVIADLSEPDLSINRADPEWNLDLYDRYTSVVDTLANYDNVLGFFAGNEVTNAANNTDADVFVKAAIRDMKSYISDKGYRSIPVGYSASDDASIRIPEASYFCCGDESEKADFYGINMYEWCGDSDYQTSGYKNATDNFEGLGVPLFFSEYGCNAVKPRKFQEVGTLYGSDMDSVWSGGIVYMYFQEDNDYGLVSIDGSSVSTLDDFGYLSSALATISPSIRQSSDASASTTTPSCPSTGSYWAANTNLPPTPDRGVCECLSPAAGCVVSDDVDEGDYGDLFSSLCGSGQISCDAINANGTTGEYGAFEFCDSKDKLNYLLNLYYQKVGASSSNCDWDGSASVNTATSTADACKAVFSQVGSGGSGSVTASVSATGSATAGSDASAAAGSGSSKASGGSASGSAAAASGSASSSGGNNAAVRASGHLALCGAAIAGVAVLFAGVL